MPHAELGLLEPRAWLLILGWAGRAGHGTILITWGGLGLVGSPLRCLHGLVPSPQVRD